MSKNRHECPLPQDLWDDDWIVGRPVVIRSGKEATVYRCEAHPATGRQWIAAKRYRPMEHRGFRNDAAYREGRVIVDARLRRASAAKSRTGRRLDFNLWMGHEHETLAALRSATPNVPQPLALVGDTLLIEYIGDENGPAPQLAQVDLDAEEARDACEGLLRDIETWLSLNVVHADLSPFNVLYWQGRTVTIDFPQAVDARFNPNARSLLLHDVQAICDHFAAYGLDIDWERLAASMWAQYRLARL